VIRIPSDAPEKVKKQIKRLYSEDIKERVYAIILLGKMEKEAIPAVPFLLGMLDDQSNVFYGRIPTAISPGAITAWALGEIGDKRAVEPLIAVLGNDNWSIRNSAVLALNKLKDKRAVMPIISLLNDENNSVRWESAKALGEFGDARAVEPLIGALKDKEIRVRKSASMALSKFNNPHTIELLIVALEDKDMRVAVAETLGLVGDGRAVEILINIINDKDTDILVLNSAIDAMGSLGDPRALELLISMLKDENIRIKKSAALSLGKIGDIRAIDPLIAALKDSDIKKTAEDALWNIKSPATIESLINVMSESNKDVLFNLGISDVLRRLTGRNIGYEKKKWITWWKENKEKYIEKLKER
jgi:HEAT repeat protein